MKLLILKKYSIDWWKKRYKNIFKYLHLSFYIYLSILIAFIAVLLYHGLNEREEIALTITDFSVLYNEDLDGIKIDFYGVVPKEVVDSYGINNIKKGKLYINASNSVLHSDIVRMSLGNIKFRELHSSAEGYGQHQKNIERFLSRSGGAKVGVLSGVIEINRIDQKFDFMKSIISGDPSAFFNKKIKKIKIIMGDTPILKFWAEKLFFKSDVMVKFRNLID
jgi:hypothetical protein